MDCKCQTKARVEFDRLVHVSGTCRRNQKSGTGDALRMCENVSTLPLRRPSETASKRLVATPLTFASQLQHRCHGLDDDNGLLTPAPQQSSRKHSQPRWLRLAGLFASRFGSPTGVLCAHLLPDTLSQRERLCFQPAVSGSSAVSLNATFVFSLHSRAVALHDLLAFGSRLSFGAR
jgi:hypothetical protein